MTTIDLTYPTPQRRTYAPIGRCIYCGRGHDAGKLSKEHIIPLGLSGTLILPQASCAACGKITGDVERFYLQQMIRDARIHLNLASRRKRRNKLPPPPLLIGRRLVAGATRWDEVPKDRHPYWLPTCGFAPAGILTNADPEHKPLVEMCLLPGQDWQARWGLQSPNAKVEMHIDSDRYARMLAKIAHAFAVATYGVDSFEHFLPEIILGKNDIAHRFVGGVERDMDDRSAVATILHSIGSEPLGDLLTVRLRLFSFINGTPSYIIVVGRTLRSRYSKRWLG